MASAVGTTSLKPVASASEPVVDPSPNALFGAPSPKSPESDPPSPSHSPNSPEYGPCDDDKPDPVTQWRKECKCGFIHGFTHASYCPRYFVATQPASDVKSASVSLSGGGCGRGRGGGRGLIPAARHFRDAAAATAAGCDTSEPESLPVAKPVLTSTKRSASAAAAASSDDSDEDPDFIPLDPKTEELNPANTPEENETVMRFFGPKPAKRKATDATSESVSASASAAAVSASEDGAQPSSKKAKADSKTSASSAMTDTGRIKDIGTLLTVTQEQALYDAMDKERTERCGQNRHLWCNCRGPFSLNPDCVVTWADLRARELLARD